MNRIAWTMVFLMTWGVAASALAGENATPEEVIQKVREAAAYLESAGDPGLEAFMDKTSRWVWKDTYVFVLNCENGVNAAHPIKPQMVGMKQIGLRDTDGKLFFAEFCNLAKNPKGGWVDYMWPKVGEKTPSRKVTYVLQVPGQPYQVGAGIYETSLPMADLEKLLD